MTLWICGWTDHVSILVDASSKEAAATLATACTVTADGGELVTGRRPDRMQAIPCGTFAAEVDEDVVAEAITLIPFEPTALVLEGFEDAVPEEEEDDDGGEPVEVWTTGGAKP